MNRPLPAKFFLTFGVLYLFGAGILVYAQPQNSAISGEIPPRGIRGRTVAMDINARVLNESQAVTWEQIERKVTTPGTPVAVRLVGSNVVVVVQFTPFIRRNSGNVLVAQSQIWISDPQRNGVSYYTYIQTIPMVYGEAIHFFPLGQSQQLNASIEIMLVVNPSDEAVINEEETVATRDN
jgi:hypothetical protein